MSNSENEKLKVWAFVELISNVKGKIEDDVYIFKMKKMRSLHKNC